MTDHKVFNPTFSKIVQKFQNPQKMTDQELKNLSFLEFNI